MKNGLVQSTARTKILLIPLILGIILIAHSWFYSYPITISSSTDFAFNHIQIEYWFGLSITFASLFLMAAESKSHTLKWLVCVGFVIALYSISYFYYTLNTSDSSWFRGLVEYSLKTNDFTASISHAYFQWPSYFILTNIATSVSGLKLADFEFLQYTLIGFLMASALYVYSSKNFKKGGFLAPILFFVSMFYFLNYQDVPFSLAFALLLVLWMLETRPRSTPMILVMIVIFIGICLTHAFVPFFFVLYFLIRAILGKSRQYGYLFFITVTIYLFYQLNLAYYSLPINLRFLFAFEPEYSGLVQAVLVPISNPIDAIAQQFSRISTIAVILFCSVSFTYLLIKKRTQNLDKAIFLTGVFYTGLGVAIYALGSRAIPIVFIPVSLGTAYLLESRFRRYIKAIVVVLLIFVVFIPIHVSLNEATVPAQTKEAYITANFLLEKYDWNLSTTMLLDQTSKAYLDPQIMGQVTTYSNLYVPLNFSEIRNYDYIIYNVGFETALRRSGISAEETSQEIQSEFDVVYDSGSTYIAIGRAQR